MAETIKNTLFRFVTLRSPELIPEKDKQDYHIHHPNPANEGHFKDQIASPATTPAAQAAALKTRAESFSPLTNTAATKAFAGAGLFVFSVWLAKNRYAVYHQQTIVFPSPLPATLTNSQVITIWDNLFYQLITGSNPQLRQHFIEILVANGYLAAGEGYQHQLAEARVIIPSAFYSDTPGNTMSRTLGSSVSENEGFVNTGSFKEITAGIIAQKKITQYQQLMQELRKAEKKYQKENQASFETARNTFETSIKEEFDKFNSDTPTDAGVNDPRVPGPDALPFTFTPQPEMDETFLQTNLSAGAFAYAQQLDLPGSGSFADAYTMIQQAMDAEMLKGNPGNTRGNKSIVVNNVVLPVQERTLPNTPAYSFYMEAVHHQGNNYSILLTVSMDNAGVHAVGAEYNAVLTGGISTNTAYTEIASQVNALTLELYPGGSLSLANAQTDFRLHGRIDIQGRIRMLFDVQFSLFEGAWGIMDLEKTSGGGGDPVTIEAPSGYGIKRLGVADYRKVEQSVCCYLPGEVSHIENVMAREYKERSSRRLSRIEDTTIFERSMEKEVQKDSSTTERYELQKEIETIVSKETSADANASVNGSTLGGVNYSASANFAFNTSKEDSNRTAVNYSKEVTEKALERVVQKIREERTIKIVEEFEEQHKHGFDNRLGDKHVSGVYRWVDKVYKNQVYNYGKRLMYEFMIPQPAPQRSHKIARSTTGSYRIGKTCRPAYSHRFLPNEQSGRC